MNLSVAIIGAGFSGVLTAVHLLRSAHVSVSLIERSGRFGPGLAYGTPHAEHLLNVPAGNMSVFDDDPTHFLRWAHERDTAVATGSFLPRAQYGLYLEHILAGVRSGAGARLKEIWASAISAERVPPDRFAVRLSSGESLQADRVVLALGNAPPPPLPGMDPALAGHPGCIHDPWVPGVLDRVRPDDPVLIVGTGLTMMDAVMTLHGRDHAGPILAISRHGLLPRPHRSPSRPPRHRAPPDALRHWDGSAKAFLLIMRRAIQESATHGTDWRDIVTSIRPATAALWERMPARERGRFLDRLRSYWDVVRHRAAPETAAAVNDLVASRRLRVRAARLVRLRSWPANPALVEAAFRPRGSDILQSVRVARVINCLGPETDLRRIRDPLLGQLLAGGLIAPDPHFLGAEVGESGAALGPDGRPSPGLFVVGPWRRAQAWENTAVPELRRQAAAVARAVGELTVPAVR